MSFYAIQLFFKIAPSAFVKGSKPRPYASTGPVVPEPTYKYVLTDKSGNVIPSPSSEADKTEAKPSSEEKISDNHPSGSAAPSAEATVEPASSSRQRLSNSNEVVPLDVPIREVILPDIYVTDAPADSQDLEPPSVPIFLYHKEKPASVSQKYNVVNGRKIVALPTRHCQFHSALTNWPSDIPYPEDERIIPTPKARPSLGLRRHRTTILGFDEMRREFITNKLEKPEFLPIPRKCFTKRERAKEAGSDRLYYEAPPHKKARIEGPITEPELTSSEPITRPMYISGKFVDETVTTPVLKRKRGSASASTSRVIDGNPRPFKQLRSSRLWASAEPPKPTHAISPDGKWVTVLATGEMHPIQNPRPAGTSIYHTQQAPVASSSTSTNPTPGGSALPPRQSLRLERKSSLRRQALEQQMAKSNSDSKGKGKGKMT